MIFVRRYHRFWLGKGAKNGHFTPASPERKRRISRLNCYLILEPGMEVAFFA